MKYDEQIRDELIGAFNKIKSLITKQNLQFEMDYALLFRSEEGKKFGEKVNDLITFTARGVFFSFPFDRVYNHLIKGISSGEFRKTFQEKKDEEIDLETIDAMEKLSSDLESIETATLMLFTEEEQARFLALLTLSLYSYSEVFVDSLIDEILRVPVLAEQLWRHLETERDPFKFTLQELKEYRVHQQKFLDKKLKQEFLQRKRNPYDKLKTLVEGLGLSELVKELLDETQLQNYHLLFNEFRDIRNQIAHQQPFPSIADFEKPLIRKKIDELHDQLKQQYNQSKQELTKISDIPPRILKIFNTIFDWLERSSHSFAVVLNMSLMAVIYLAIIDQVVMTKIEYSK